MFVELASIPFGATVTIEGDVNDTEFLKDILSSDPIGAFHYTLVCSKMEEKLMANLTVKGKVYARCDLCGEETEAPCFSDLDECFTPDDEEYDIEKNGYNFAKFLQDCISLSLPREVRCKPDCKGLCLKCGVNLNKNACLCHETLIGDNNPFGALQDIIKNGGAKDGSTKK